MENAKNMIAAVKAGDLPTVQALVEKDPSLIHSTDENGLPVILIATYYGEQEIVGFLLSRGAELDIFSAAATGQLPRVKALMQQLPKLVNAYNVDGFQPLGLAAFFGYPKVVEFLLEQGAEVNSPSRNEQKVMPLHSAVAARHLGIARLLLEQGAEAYAKQEAGYTPLHEAAQNGQTDMVKLLLAYGADVHTRKDDGQTPLATALAYGQKEVADLLRHHGATE